MASKKVKTRQDFDRERMLKVLRKLKKAYPDSKCSLIYETPFQLLIATILSAQCTDERVNQTTPALFKKFPDAKKMSKASIVEVEKLVRSTGFYKHKARNIVGTAKLLMEKHQGEVPARLEDLVELMGVGRKTANVLLGYAFGIPGLVVDTHVGRLSRRMGFTEEKNPVKVEAAMMEIVPKSEWIAYSHLLIDHGRALCMARKPNCEDCFLKAECPRVGVA